MRSVFLGLVLCAAISAQVTVSVSPVPRQVLSALHLRSMGMASVYIINTGPSQRTVAPEQIYSALVSIHPVDPITAQQILAQRQAASAPSAIARYLGYGAEVGSIILAIISKSNIQIAFWVSAAGGATPQLESLFESATPSIAAYGVQALNSTIVLGAVNTAGYSTTKTIFVDRTRWVKGSTPTSETFTVQ